MLAEILVKLRMPSATGDPAIVEVDAYLLAGRPPQFDDLVFWNSLFRSQTLIIEGRVPVPASESYLLNSRLNSGRELVAVSFMPRNKGKTGSYQELSNGLLAKGLVSQP